MEMLDYRYFENVTKVNVKRLGKDPLLPILLTEENIWVLVKVRTYLLTLN